MVPEASAVWCRGALRALGALGWRWALRTVLVYVAAVVGPLVVDLGSEPGAAAPRGYLGAHLGLLLLVTPTLVAVGAAWATVVWASLVVTRGGQGAASAAAGVAGTLAVVAWTLVMSDPGPVDLLVYTVCGLGVGAVAAWVTSRDVTRVRDVSGWVARMRACRPGAA